MTEQMICTEQVGACVPFVLLPQRLLCNFTLPNYLDFQRYRIRGRWKSWSTPCWLLLNASVELLLEEDANLSLSLSLV